ncbi:transposase [Candidatus Vondammii sp. HM_W22]|uniref:transposase n=1 Tax=Candidatus Vondammii sp. HM_W22 TaxID=2687299 RepID=UPI002E7C4556|nr:transposase [Candidatus Vondammii sp. HM_W22]
MFKAFLLQHLSNLSDDQTEFQIRGRYSFCHFLVLSREGTRYQNGFGPLWGCRKPSTTHASS